jgi:glutaredoxin
MKSFRLRVFTRPKCILCKQVTEQLTIAKLPFLAIQVETPEDEEAIQRRHQARSFPMIVLDGEYLGGFTHIVHLLANGRLAALLADKTFDTDE